MSDSEQATQPPIIPKANAGLARHLLLEFEARSGPIRPSQTRRLTKVPASSGATLL